MKTKLNYYKTKLLNIRMIFGVPKLILPLTNINSNSWFSISEGKLKRNPKFTENNYTTNFLNSVKFKSMKITLILNRYQKNMINNWLNAYSKMYNYTLKYIKNNNNIDFNFIKLRSLLKFDKQHILKKSNIKVHDIDGAIKLACSMYKSALTNYKNGNIKQFRIRYWKKKKKIKIMDLEKNNFTKDGIRVKILGKIQGYYNNEKYDFSKIKHDCRLQKKEDKYYLYVPEKIEKEDKIKSNKQITIDPGIRTFITGITENKVIKIEDDKNKIKKYLIRNDKIQNNEKITKEIKKKNEKMINKKIRNLVNELQWKTINYLTKNNKIILMVNMSTKNISKKEGNLNSMSKRIVSMIRLYEFKERLKYKCEIRGVKYGEINEWMTSKMCSKCGNIKEELGGKKIYECKICKIKIDRDVNGARNIHIKAIK